MSLIWRYFSLKTQKSKTATCNVCKADIPKVGRCAASYNITNLIKYLQKYHVKDHQEFMLADKQKKTTPE